MYSPGYLLSDWMREGSILSLGSVLSAWGFSLLLFRRPIQPILVSSVRSSRRWRLSTWFTTIASQSIWLAALVLGAGIGLSEGLIFGLIEGLIFGLLVSITVVLVHTILASTIGYLRFAERIHWTWRGLLRPKHLQTSLIVASATFLFIGLSVGLSGRLSGGLFFGLIFGLGSGLSFGLGYWITTAALL
jgi:hypothetical protein